MQRTPAGLIAAMSLAALACSGDPTGESPTPTALDTLIEQAPDFYVPHGQAVLFLNARVPGGEAELVALLASGYARVSADSDGDIALEQVEIAIEDVTVGDKTSLDAVRLTDVSARLVARAECSHIRWNDRQDHCTAIIPATLIVTWSQLVTDGVAIALPPLEARDVSYGAQIWDDGGLVDGGLVLELDGQAPALPWERDDLFEVKDFSLTARGYQLLAYE